MEKDVKKIVREGYAVIANKGSSCCGSGNSCCGNSNQTVSKAIGYSDDDLSAVPDGSNLGLGCGNPVAIASLKKGEVVLDLGSGAGFDCFLAANAVGCNGQVIGVDMTPEMITRARANAREGGYENVVFRLGEIENLPVADSSIDVVISNCVINLSQEKKKVFEEAFRVLKPGGRLMVSDIVLLKKLPDELQSSEEAYIGCIAGAVLKEEYISTLKLAGFQSVKILGETTAPVACFMPDAEEELTGHPARVPFTETAESIKVFAIKPDPSSIA